jgi:hypothetical protein
MIHEMVQVGLERVRAQSHALTIVWRYRGHFMFWIVKYMLDLEEGVQLAMKYGIHVACMLAIEPRIKSSLAIQRYPRLCLEPNVKIAMIHHSLTMIAALMQPSKVVQY